VRGGKVKVKGVREEKTRRKGGNRREKWRDRDRGNIRVGTIRG